MNIVEYRAMKAQEAQSQQEQQVDSQSKGEQTNVPAQQTATTPATQANEATSQTSDPSNQGGEQTSAQTEPSQNQTPTFVEIDGKQVPIEELTQGYLRQSDYTRKTQELAKEKQDNLVAKKVYEAITSNPELANELKEKGLPIVDPTQAQLIEINAKYQDLLLEKEIDMLKGRYEDFDTREVLQFAYDNKYENLEDAYLLLKSRQGASAPASEPIDVQALTEQIRQQVLAELQSSVDTNTIIQTGGETSPVRDNVPTLTQQELKIASNMRMKPEEYVKWRDKR